jgi:hypothetical protein
VEVVKVPKQRGRPRKPVEAEISQFKECSLKKRGMSERRKNHMIPLTNIDILNEFGHIPYF